MLGNPQSTLPVSVEHSDVATAPQPEEFPKSQALKGWGLDSTKSCVAWLAGMVCRTEQVVKSMREVIHLQWVLLSPKESGKSTPQFPAAD